MKYVFIINPTAGKGKVQEPFANSIKEYFEKNLNSDNVFFASIRLPVL